MLSFLSHNKQNISCKVRHSFTEGAYDECFKSRLARYPKPTLRSATKSIMSCPALSVLLSVFFMLLDGTVQQQLPSEIDFGNSTCTVYVENLLGDMKIKPPKRVDVYFKLFSREDLNGTDLLQGSRRDETFKLFNSKLNTKFIIHGFMSRATASWIVNLRKGLLKREDCNVITVDWSRESGSPYGRAVQRAHLVAEKISHMISSLVESKGADPTTFHVIGLSLGAQIAGLAGQRIDKIGRITGLDPAAPLFLNVSDSERLDPSDAEFVDVIHTNADCLGAGWPCGHVDFYPNGGADQPGCKKVDYLNNDVMHIVHNAICSHGRAADLFVESVLSNNDGQFMGLMSDSYESFLKEKSTFSKQMEFCPMGINADIFYRKGEPYDKPRLFYLTTNAAEPYGVSQDFI